MADSDEPAKSIYKRTCGRTSCLGASNVRGNPLCRPLYSRHAKVMEALKDTNLKSKELVMATAESKIALTHRLQREGRWEEATFARDEERQRLRAEGMKRKESNEASWVWMAEQFPPLSEEELRWSPSAECLAIADFPVSHPAVEAEGELPFHQVWAFLCYSVARQIQLDADNPAGAAAVDRITADARGRADPALTPVAAMDKLDAVLQRLDADPAADHKLAEELGCFRAMVVEVLGAPCSVGTGGPQ